MEEEEHEVYGGEIPDEGEMEGDVDMSAADDDAAVKELDEMKRRLKEMEEEAAALREMQAKVEKEIGSVQGFSSHLFIILSSINQFYLIIFWLANIHFHFEPILEFSHLALLGSCSSPVVDLMALESTPIIIVMQFFCGTLNSLVTRIVFLVSFVHSQIPVCFKFVLYDYW